MFLCWWNNRPQCLAWFDPFWRCENFQQPHWCLIPPPPLGSYYDAGKFQKNIGNKIKSHLPQYRGYKISVTICRADNLQFDITSLVFLAIGWPILRSIWFNNRMLYIQHSWGNDWTRSLIKGGRLSTTTSRTVKTWELINIDISWWFVSLPRPLTFDCGKEKILKRWRRYQIT
jgi:hypothetical protein